VLNGIFQALSVLTDKLCDLQSMLDQQQIKQLAEIACRKNVEAGKMVGPFIMMDVITEPSDVAMLFYSN